MSNYDRALRSLARHAKRLRRQRDEARVVVAELLRVSEAATARVHADARWLLIRLAKDAERRGETRKP